MESFGEVIVTSYLPKSTSCAGAIAGERDKCYKRNEAINRMQSTECML